MSFRVEGGHPEPVPEQPRPLPTSKRFRVWLSSKVSSFSMPSIFHKIGELFSRVSLSFSKPQPPAHLEPLPHAPTVARSGVQGTRPQQKSPRPKDRIDFGRQAYLAWGAHVAAEHMGTGSLSGNLEVEALEFTYKSLQRVDAPSELIQPLIDKLQYAAAVEGSRNYDPAETAQKLQEDVKKLNVNESCVFMASSKTHAMLMQVRCTGIDVETGKKTYSVTQFNTGGGLEFHHAMTVDGKLRFQTAFEIENVSEQCLCGTTTFFEKVLDAKTRPTDYLYREVLPSLDGQLAGPKIGEEYRQLWSHAQFGNSCTASCIQAFIRANTSQPLFKQLKTFFRGDIFFHLFEQINPESTALSTVNVVIEIGKKILTSAPNGAVEQKVQQLQQFRRSEALKEAQPQEFGPGETETKEAVISLSNVFQDLREEKVHTPDRHQRIVRGLLKAQRELQAPPAEDRKQNVEQLVNDMIDFIHPEPPKYAPILTKDEMYLYNALISLVLDAAKAYGIDEKLLERFEEAHFSVRVNFSRMSKTTVTTHEEIDHIIQEHRIERSAKDVASQTFLENQKVEWHLSQKTPLNEIPDATMALLVATRRLQQPDCDRASIICDLISQSSIPLSDIIQKISFEGLEQNTLVLEAIQNRVQTESNIPENQKPVFGTEFSQQLKNALANKQSWEESVRVARDSAHTLIDYF